MRQDISGLNCYALMRLHDEKGSLFPFRMRDPDDGRDPDARTGDRNILDIDRTDPFAASLDHVLLDVCDPH